MIEAGPLGGGRGDEGRHPGDIDQFGGEMKHQRGIDFAAMPGPGLDLSQGGQGLDSQDVDHPYPAGGSNGGERFEMLVGGMSGHDQGVAHPR